MKKGHIILILTLGLCVTCAWSQDSSQQPADSTPEGNPQQPAPAFGPDNPAPLPADNPPISGLDLPNLEPHAAPLSYLQPGAHISESLDSNVQNSLGGSGIHSITDATGSLELQRLWKNYDLALDYLGGVGYYNARGVGLKQIEELGVNQKISWKRGQLGIRDAFSYQPEGTFGSAYGSVASTGAALGGQSVFFGGTGLGELGQVPRIMNISLVDVVENLTPRSSVTAAGSYAFTHFLENDPVLGNSFIGNRQVSAQVGYNHVIGKHDQGALVYGYQDFRFSTGVSFQSHVIQLMWGHRISGRLDFIIGVGPQFTQLNNILVPVAVTDLRKTDAFPPCVVAVTNSGNQIECPRNDFRVGVAGRMQLRYQFRRASVSLSYNRFTTSGSGFFAGAQSDIATFDVNRSVGRTWTAFSDVGYSRNSRIVGSNCPAGSVTSSCTTSGVSANSYQYLFAGVGMRKQIGRTLRVYGSYQFNDLLFDNSFCQSTTPCNRISQRHVGTIGLDWTPRPMRLD